jgi:predicted amidohydrolase
MLQIASRHYAFEGRTFVLAAGSILPANALPEGLEIDKSLEAKPETLVQRGGSAIIAPDGSYIAGPIYDEETILIAALDLNRIVKESMALDVTGHYSRPDVFDFSVNRTRKSP